MAPTLVAAGALACVDEPTPSPLPPGLAEYPAEHGQLIYREHYRWYHFELELDSSQYADFYRDGDVVLMLRRDDAGRVHGWAEGRMTAATLATIEAALAQTDPSQSEVESCGWSDTFPAVIYFEGQSVAYQTLCAPPGFTALADVYRSLAGELGACPLWLQELVGEPDFVPLFAELDCAADEDWDLRA